MLYFLCRIVFCSLFVIQEEEHMSRYYIRFFCLVDCFGVVWYWFIKTFLHAYVIIFPFVLLGLVLFFITYFGALVRAMRLNQWVWFTAMLLSLLLPPFGLIGYAIFAPDDPQGRL